MERSKQSPGLRKNIYTKNDQVLARLANDRDGDNIYQKNDAVTLDNIYSSRLNQISLVPSITKCETSINTKPKRKQGTATLHKVKVDSTHVEHLPLKQAKTFHHQPTSKILLKYHDENLKWDI